MTPQLSVKLPTSSQAEGAGQVPSPNTPVKMEAQPEAKTKEKTETEPETLQPGDVGIASGGIVREEDIERLEEECAIRRLRIRIIAVSILLLKEKTTKLVKARQEFCNGFIKADSIQRRALEEKFQNCIEEVGGIETIEKLARQSITSEELMEQLKGNKD